jgi:hypothetical protein
MQTFHMWLLPQAVINYWSNRHMMVVAVTLAVAVVVVKNCDFTQAAPWILSCYIFPCEIFVFTCLKMVWKWAETSSIHAKCTSSFKSFFKFNGLRVVYLVVETTGWLPWKADVWSFRGSDCNTDQYLANAKVMERLRGSKKTAHKF